MDIQNLKQAVKEIARIYATLRKRGLEIEYLNVGGGLGVNYEAGEVTSPHGINYTLPEYVNAIVYTVKEVCDAENVNFKNPARVVAVSSALIDLPSSSILTA